MTVTLELSPEAEADLHERAAKRGQSAADYLLTLAESEDYADIYWWKDEADHEDEIATIKERLADIQAGEKGIPLEDFHADMVARIELRKKRQAVGTAA